MEGGGTHDTLFPACDEIRYRNLGVKFPNDADPGEGHRSCAMNLEEELCRYMRKSPEGHGTGIEAPAPLNLFMNVPLTLPSGSGTTTATRQDSKEIRSGQIHIAAPVGPKGGYIEFKAQMDLLVIMSACPSDMAKTNGEDMICKDAGFEVLD